MLRFVICCMHTIFRLARILANFCETTAECEEVFYTDLSNSVEIEGHVRRLERHQRILDESRFAYIYTSASYDFGIPAMVSGAPGTIS